MSCYSEDMAPSAYQLREKTRVRLHSVQKGEAFTTVLTPILVHSTVTGLVDQQVLLMHEVMTTERAVVVRSSLKQQEGYQ